MLPRVNGSKWRHGPDWGYQGGATLNGRMPNALIKEGTLMRIQHVTDVNTNHQQNPYITKKADAETLGKNASLGSFKECLRSYVQDPRAPAVTQKAEMMAAGALWNGLITQRTSLRSKPEMKQKIRVYTSLPDL